MDDQGAVARVDSAHVKWSPDKPGLLILDGHYSHTRNLEAIDYLPRERHHPVIAPSAHHLSSPAT